jgi:hypothetical protein
MVARGSSYQAVNMFTTICTNWFLSSIILKSNCKHKITKQEIIREETDFRRCITSS